MKGLLFTIANKEFLHILRDKKTLLLLTVLPMLQVLIFGFTLSNELKELPVAVVTMRGSQQHIRLCERIDANTAFSVVNSQLSPGEIAAGFRRGAYKAVLVLPANHQERIQAGESPGIALLIDGSNPNEGMMIVQQMTAILANELNLGTDARRLPQVDIRYQMRYNPELKAAPQYVPGVISVVLMLICVMMTANALVREKESKCIYFLLLTGLSPLTFLLGKSLPYLCFALVSTVMIMLLGIYIIGIPLAGHMLKISMLSALFVCTCLCLGIFIASVVDKQESALLFTLIGMVIPTFMFAGFMFPLDNMPVALQWLSHLVPSKYFYSALQGTMIKKTSLEYNWPGYVMLLMMSIFFFTLGLVRFNKHYR